MNTDPAQATARHDHQSPPRHAPSLGMTFDDQELRWLEAQRRSPTAQAKMRGLLALLDLQPGERLLDLGCGGGAFARLAAPLVVPSGQVVGVDASPAAVALASAQQVDSTLSFVEGDGQALTFDTAAFDTAVCISVLAFVEDPAAVVAELSRVVRPGGRLLIVSADEDTRVYNSVDRALGRRVLRAMADRAHDPWIGRRLFGLLGRAGLEIVSETVATTVERDFDATAGGAILARTWRDVAVASGAVDEAEYDRWLADLASCAQRGDYAYSVTSYTYLVRRSGATRIHQRRAYPRCT